MGAGLGLCGILASRLEPQYLVLTDGDSDTLANLRHNVNANSDTHNVIVVAQLIWGEDLEKFRNLHGQFSVILGADIIYVPELLGRLWQTVDTLLTDSGTFVLAYTRRNVSMDLVIQHATASGFQATSNSNDEKVFVFRRRVRSSTDCESST